MIPFARSVFDNSQDRKDIRSPPNLSIPKAGPEEEFSIASGCVHNARFDRPGKRNVEWTFNLDSLSVSVYALC